MEKGVSRREFIWKNIKLMQLFGIPALFFCLYPRNSLAFNIVEKEFKDKYEKIIPDEINIQELSTHPLITLIAVKFVLSNEIKREAEHFLYQLIKGTIEEDIPVTRAWNHFYNPETGNGLALAVPTIIPNIDFIPLPAPDWIKGDKRQAIISENFTYRNAVRFYKEAQFYRQKRDEKTAFFRFAKAYENLGHVLHIIQDMHVIDHVTLSPHFPPTEESIFETYADKVYDNILRDFIYGRTILDIQQIERYSSLDDYIKNSAFFTLNFYKEKFGDRRSKLKGAFLGDESKLAKIKLDEHELKDIAGTLIPNAISASAGFIEFFYNTVNEK